MQSLLRKTLDLVPAEKAAFQDAHQEILAIISLDDLTKTESSGTNIQPFGNLCPPDAFDRRYRMAALLRALRRNSTNLATVTSRLWSPARRSEFLDYRRSISRNILHGGDILHLYHKKHKLKKLKMVVVCDVSASMLRHMKFVLPLFFGLSAVRGRHETFVFANALERVTPIFRKYPDIARATDIFLSQTSQVGHGTDITQSLNDLKNQYSQLLTSTTLLVLISDGETFNPVTAAAALKNVGRRVQRILWLNTQDRDALQQNPMLKIYRKFCQVRECRDLEQLIQILRNM